MFDVRTTDYLFAHGKQPKGKGTWAFFIGSRNDMDKIWFSPLYTSYAAAKRMAIDEAKRQGAVYVTVGS